MVLTACNPQYEVIDPSDDLIFFTSNKDHHIVANGEKRYYSVVGINAALTSKGKVLHLDSGQCMEYATGDIKLYPIFNLIKIAPALDLPEVRAEAEKQKLSIK